MSTESFEVNESKVKAFAEKLTVAIRLRNYARMEDAAEAFVGLFEGESIVAVSKFIEHIGIVCDGVDSYYRTKQEISAGVLSASRERRRWNRQSNSDRDHDPRPRE